MNRETLITLVKMTYRTKLLILLCVVVSVNSYSQDSAVRKSHMTVVADSSFSKKSLSWQKKWGYNRRTEWTTPVTVPVFLLDTAFGGLKPYERGGGNESRTLHLKTAAGKEYTLRSITKSRDDVIPPDFNNTFGETIIKDGISSSHPYGSFALPAMQEKIGLLYTTPALVWLPRQNALDSFNTRFGDGLYLLEQRPDGNWEEAPNLGRIKDFTSTEKLVLKLQEDNRYRTAQYDFIKARLFDMLIGDWDRHEGNWRWARQDGEGKNRLYIPVGRDRDQAFYTHNGKLLDKVLPAAGFSFMQHFDHTIGNPVTFNVASKDMDRHFANEMTLADWVKAANELRVSLTDEVITGSVRQLPPEIYAVSGQELIEKLKSRREQLPAIATTYYLHIAKEVEITGTVQKEYFDISTTDDTAITVTVSRFNDKGEQTNLPIYKRTFIPSETSEIRLFGIGGDDIYKISAGSGPITIRVIGGPGHDSVVQTGKRIHIYDNRDNSFRAAAVRWHLSSDSSVHRYDYKNYNRSSRGFSPAVGYNNADRIYVGLKYSFTTHRWRREPYSTKQTFRVHYAIQQTSASAAYNAIYPNVLGKWDFFVDGGFDAVRWTNYFGLGNETVSVTKRNGYHRTLSHEWLGDMGMRIGNDKSSFEFAGFYQQTKIKRDTGSYVARYFPGSYKDQLVANHYAGAWLSYKFASVNDRIVPTRGFTSFLKAIYSRNLTQKEFLQNYSAKLQAWLPLGKKFSLAIGAGGATIVGEDALLNSARIYEHAVIGGTRTLRGYRVERFWGKSSFYNSNELRFITNIKGYLLNAKAGLIAFFDDGRVWIPGEHSNTLHTSYGGGILFAPFNMVSVTVTYGISDETRLVQLRLNSLF